MNNENLESIPILAEHVLIDECSLSKLEQNISWRDFCKDAKRCLLTLCTREYQVLILFFGLRDLKEMIDDTKERKQYIYHLLNTTDGLTLDEIAAFYDLTRERARQIKEKAVRRLRHKSRSNLLLKYLG